MGGIAGGVGVGLGREGGGVVGTVLVTWPPLVFATPLTFVVAPLTTLTPTAGFVCRGERALGGRGGGLGDGAVWHCSQYSLLRA